MSDGQSTIAQVLSINNRCIRSFLRGVDDRQHNRNTSVQAEKTLDSSSTLYIGRTSTQPSCTYTCTSLILYLKYILLECDMLVENTPFLQRVSIACYAERCISHSKSVRPSVCPSVRHTLALSQNDSSYDHGVFTGG